jgi:hypothetical protein
MERKCCPHFTVFHADADVSFFLYRENYVPVQLLLSFSLILKLSLSLEHALWKEKKVVYPTHGAFTTLLPSLGLT